MAVNGPVPVLSAGEKIVSGSGQKPKVVENTGVGNAASMVIQSSIYGTRHGLSYRDACMKLGMSPKKCGSAQGLRMKEKVSFSGEEKKEMSDDKWQHQAGLYIETFQERLWDEQGKDARDFLHGKGLSDESIRAAGLGWSPLVWYLTREEWGLPTEIKPDGKPKKLWIPKGIAIPCYEDGRIIRLRVRCADPDK